MPVKERVCKKMKERFRQFMVGRYGSDGLGIFLSRASLAVMVAALLLSMLNVGFASSLLMYLAMAMLVYSYFRIFSRNREKRVQENYAYYALRGRVTGWFSNRKKRLADSRTHHYFKCPSCGQQVRVPKGRGLIAITCPKCHNEFRKKS